MLLTVKNKSKSFRLKKKINDLQFCVKIPTQFSVFITKIKRFLQQKIQCKARHYFCEK